MSHDSYYQPIPTEIFVKIFSFFTIKNHPIEIFIITMNQVDGYKFDLINQFISLKSLSLQNVNFITLFTLKLYDLEDLSLRNCKKITLVVKKFLKLKTYQFQAELLIQSHY